jgi:hypothetical protein
MQVSLGLGSGLKAGHGLAEMCSWVEVRAKA